MAISLEKKQERFIRKSKIVHGNKYGYHKFIYLGCKIKGIVTCDIHGDFPQTPNDHMNGVGCPECSLINRIKLRSSNLDEFLKNARNIHGDKYGYDKFIYINNYTKGVINCPVDGDFFQTPNRHLSGGGCKKCYDRRRKFVKLRTLEEFINKAILVHGYLYNYSKTVYINANSKLTITCLKHGDFQQTANDHLRGNGCPVCKASRGEVAIFQILQKHGIEFEREYVIPNIENKYRYDFYLPKHNLLIEFHGEQHYRPVDCFGGKEAFETLVIRDSIKRDIAKAWGYKYLEIKYTLLKDLTKEEFEKKINKLYY